MKNSQAIFLSNFLRLESAGGIVLIFAAALCGIGFTMSLFVGSLAFEETSVNLLFDERLGIILGSLASGVIGYLVLKKGLSSHNNS